MDRSTSVIKWVFKKFRTGNTEDQNEQGIGKTVAENEGPNYLRGWKMQAGSIAKWQNGELM